MPTSKPVPDHSEWATLLNAAWTARERAYAPYSGFKVGAALYLENGSVVVGCNVENAAYPVTLCAERTALCSAVAQFGLSPGQLRAMVIVTESNLLTPPCGACRQALAEFAENLPILLANRQSQKLCNLEELLPDAFTGRSLNKPF